MNILVTGGAGYIGSHACKALNDAGFLPVVYDNLLAGRRERVKWGPLEEGDIRDATRMKEVFEKYRPKAVMHFAGLISVPDSVKNPEETFSVNTYGSQVLLETMLACGVKTIVFSSTAAVYGTPENIPIREDAAKKPINPYGESKLKTENLLAQYAAEEGFAYAVLRYFNAAGATPEEGLGYNRPNPFHLIPVAMLATLGRIPPMQLNGSDYPTPDGTAIRDYIHVADLIEAHILALQYLLEGKGNLTLNLGTSKGYSVQEVLDTSRKVTGKEVPHSRAARRPGDPAALVADATEAAKVLNWRPTRSSLENIIQSDWIWHSSK